MEYVEKTKQEKHKQDGRTSICQADHQSFFIAKECMFLQFKKIKGLSFLRTVLR